MRLYRWFWFFFILILASSIQANGVESSAPTTALTTVAIVKRFSSTMESAQTTAQRQGGWDQLQHDWLVFHLRKDVEWIRRAAADPKVSEKKLAAKIRFLCAYCRGWAMPVELKELGTSELELRKLQQQHRLRRATKRHNVSP